MQKTFHKIPKHYYKVSAGHIRKGDIIVNGNSYGCLANTFIGESVNFHPSYTVWRRRHVAVRPKKAVVTDGKMDFMVDVKELGKKPLVEFWYPSSTTSDHVYKRRVRLISANAKYLVGIEVSDKNRFKKFLVSKVIGDLKLIEYNPAAMP